ncbi:tRNA (uracil-5-)-methyltransferase homolog B-like [Macrosteles quadrilineatus]|uniref:tRNA (uracil-5-)-methyltransferase homolog B-like n=1 Tax=Macrosteles quadrilineatus TaxID=74068 RepID=UPI0023E090D2|nr:tRNA (uracil-5-)-methyltransferase homolog B-like [Macrosteles quadrilineatus]
MSEHSVMSKLCFVTCNLFIFSFYLLSKHFISSTGNQYFPETELLYSNVSKRVFKPLNPRVTEENQHNVLLKKICPFHRVSYPVELEVKQNNALRVVDALIKRLQLIQTEITDFPVEKIVPSPVKMGYRNKDDFTVYYGVDKNKPTVGYLTGTPSKSGCKAVRPTHLPHVKDSHKRLALLFEQYIHNSPHKVCYFFRDGGFWKRFTVRSNEAGELMVIVVTHPYSMTQEELMAERTNLTNYFLSHEPNLILYHQECERVDCSNDVNSYVQLAGKKSFLEEIMGGFKFRISPHSFFQINKKAAENMVLSILDDMEVTNETTFLDLFSGVGLYSILGSHRVNNSIGVEYLEQAVIDAKKNAEINNITNCEFIAGRVEKRLHDLLTNQLASIENLGMVTNPGRAGTTKKVAQMIRRDKRIKKLTYVSCKPDNPHTFNNFVQLCRRGTQVADPFKIKRIRLFDLFPRTAHYEMVLEFER